MKVTLHERLEFKLKLTHEQSERNKRDVQRVLESCPPPTESGDELNLTYALDVLYIGEVVARLEALERLAEDGVIVGGSVDEIKYGSCLLMNVLRSLERLSVKVLQQ